MWRGDAIASIFWFYAVSWMLYFAIVALSWSIYQKRIDRVQEGYMGEGQSKPILLYASLDNGAILEIFLPFFISTILIFPLLIFFPNNVSSSQFENMIWLLVLFLALGSIGLISYLYSMFYGVIEASDEGVQAIRLKKQEAIVRSSIRWTEVTGVDLSSTFKHTVKVDGAGKRIKIRRYLENLAPLLEMMSRKVPKAVCSNVALDYISIYGPGTVTTGEKGGPQEILGSRSANSSANQDILRMKYASFYKAYCVILSAFFLSLLWGYFFPIVAHDPLSIYGLFVLFFTLLAALWIMEVFLVYYSVCSEGIEQRSMYRGRIVIKWNDIQSISFKSGAQGSIFLIMGDRKKITLVCHVNGLPQFARAVMARLPPERWVMAKLELVNYLKSKS